MLRLILIAVGVILLGGCGAHSRYESHLQRGKQFLAAGNLDKASIEFRNALQIQPKAAEALYLAGRVAEQRGSPRDAAGLYQAAIDIQADFEPPRASLGRLYVFAGASQRALDTVSTALDTHPNNPDLLAVRAAARHQLKDDPNALKDAQRAVQLAPANENALAILASLYSQSGDRARAIALISRAVQAAPTSVDLREVLTNLYLQADEPEQAEQQIRKIIELRPQEIAARTQLALHLARHHRLDAAQAVLEAAVVDFSKGKDVAKADQAKLSLIEFVSTQRSREQAQKTLRAFIAKEPDNAELRLALGTLQQQGGATDDALATYREVVTREGKQPCGLVALDRIAAIQFAQGHVEVARKGINEVLQRNPRDDEALLLRANIALTTHDPGSAIADLRAVLRDQPRSAAALQGTLARAYLEKGEPALAEEALRAAVDAAPEEALPRVQLSQYLIQTSRDDQAVALLEESVRRLPKASQLREALIQAYLTKRNLVAARAAAEDLKSLQGSSASGFYLAGWVAFEQGRLQDSQRELEHALTLAPASVDTLRALVKVDAARGKPELSIARVQAASAREPKNVQILNLLGELAYQGRDFAQAIHSFTAAATLDPRWATPYRNRALARNAQNDTAGALEDYQTALKLAPLEPPLVIEAATFFEKQGRIELAAAAYQALYDGNRPAQQLAANNLAMLLATYKTDRVSLDRALDLTSSFASSENGSLLDTNGWVRFKRGEYRDALAVLERASARSPDSKIIRYHLAMAELQLGMTDRARTHLQSALAGSEDFSGSDDARVVLARLSPRSG